MKKLMMSLAAVAMVGAANAAATWQFSGVDDPNYGYAYIFKYGDADFISNEFLYYIESGDTESYRAAMVAIRDEQLDGGVFNGGSGSGECDGFSSDNTYSIVFLDNSTKPTMYMVSEEMWYEGSTMSFDMSGSKWIELSPTPEPTSGMLMLLGLAGLALKRKRV